MISITSCARTLTHHYTLTDCAVAWFIQSHRGERACCDVIIRRWETVPCSRGWFVWFESTAKIRVQRARDDSLEDPWGSSTKTYTKLSLVEKATLRFGRANSQIGRCLEREQVPLNAPLLFVRGIMGTDNEWLLFKARRVPKFHKIFAALDIARESR